MFPSTRTLEHLPTGGLLVIGSPGYGKASGLNAIIEQCESLMSRDDSGELLLVIDMKSEVTDMSTI